MTMTITIINQQKKKKKIKVDDAIIVCYCSIQYVFTYEEYVCINEYDIYL